MQFNELETTVTELGTRIEGFPFSKADKKKLEKEYQKAKLYLNETKLEIKVIAKDCSTFRIFSELSKNKPPSSPIARDLVVGVPQAGLIEGQTEQRVQAYDEAAGELKKGAGVKEQQQLDVVTTPILTH